MVHNRVGDGLVTVIRNPKCDPLIVGFVKLQQTEARLLNFKIVNISLLLYSEDRKNCM